MDATRKIKRDAAAEHTEETTAERRRLSRVRHDERGNAYVEWIDAPADLVERPVLEIERDPRGTASSAADGSYDPYANGLGVTRSKGTGNTTRTDLRKLSEWIKMMRELEQRKRDGTSDDGEDDAR